jgi:hypothetical protein
VGSASVFALKTGSALAYCAVMAALLWRSPTSGPWGQSARAGAVQGSRLTLASGSYSLDSFCRCASCSAEAM